MKHFLLLSFLLTHCLSFTQVKGLYVDGFSTILGNAEKEDSLLRFAKNNGFNYLTLYQMHIVHANTPLTNTTTASTFAGFVSKAKTEFDILEIGVAAENFHSVNSVYHSYNQQHGTSEKIDVYNLEFEFWVSNSVDAGGYYCDTYLTPNGFPCGEAGAFDFFCQTLHKTDSLATLDGVKSEAYFGWFDALQGERIVETGVDRVLLSAYIPSANYSPAYQYSYLNSRLENLAAAEQQIKVISLHSAEPDFMQEYIATHAFDDPFNDLTDSFSAETSSWKEYIELNGYQWFTYTDLPFRNMDLGTATHAKSEFIVYPNPANGSFKLISDFTDQEEYRIYDLSGNCLESGIAGTEIQTGLKAGIYQIKIQESTRKLIIL